LQEVLALAEYYVPVKGPITCNFACHANPPRTRGTDYGVPVGTQVHAIAGGVVTLSVESGGNAGKYVEIDHGTLKSRYLHLSECKVAVGQMVMLNEIIGLSGNTGLSTGPHLHLDVGTAIEAKAKAIDPGAVWSTSVNRWMIDAEILFREPEEDDMKRIVLVRTPEGNQWIMDLERSTAIYLDEMTREIMEAEKAAGKLEIVTYTKPQSAIDAIISSRP
jgi:hypothetical protein